MATRKCKNCGKIFKVPTGSAAYLCPDCAAESREKGVIRERICKMCGATFLGYPRSFFCPACSAERKRQRQKAYNRRPSRPLGSVDICQNCGKEYIVNSGRQKYCPECAKTKVKDNIRAQKRQYRAENLEKYEKLSLETRGKRYI